MTLETSGPGSIVMCRKKRKRWEAEEHVTITFANVVLSGRLCGRQKWEPRLVRGDHDELLRCLLIGERVYTDPLCLPFAFLS